MMSLLGKMYGRRTYPINLLGITAPIWTMLLDFSTCLVRPLPPAPAAAAPQGCVMSPFLLLLTHDCTPVHGANIIIKVADDTIVSGLIKDNHESAYREEVDPWTTGGTRAPLLMKKTEDSGSSPLLSSPLGYNVINITDHF